MSIYVRLLVILVAAGWLCPASIVRAAAPADWGAAEWIGFTSDGRPSEFAERTVSRTVPGALPKAVGPEPMTPPVQRRSFPSPLLRRRFVVKKPVRAAEVMVCGLGLYELYLNGDKVGDHVLDPAETTYDKRAFFVRYDVTPRVQPGANALGLMLGNGFYGQNMAFGTSRLAYGEPRARLCLRITYADDTSEVVLSDGTWTAALGPVQFDNLYLGETFDARREQPGWSTANFDDHAWQPVQRMEAPTTNLLEQELEPMRKVRALRPVAVLPAANGEWILDLGQNMTGWLHLRVREPAGRVITARFAELLMPDQRAIDTGSTGSAITGGDQTDIYICRGGGSEEWEPRFTYHGFRYVQLQGLSRRPDPADFTGWLVRTDVARIGAFECSDPLINKFYNVSLWTIEDNLQGLLTDCPHRERCEWMGDNHVVAEVASYNFDLRKFWRKTSGDIATVLGADRPQPTSALPRDPRAPSNVSVGRRTCAQARPDWGAGTVLVPWYAWEFYGDRPLIETAWPTMTGWMAFLEEFAVKDGIISEGYGDWCPPGSNSQIDTPVAFTSTALYYQSLEAMRTMAQALGRAAEASHYEALGRTVKAALLRRFYRPDQHNFGSQTATAMALHLGFAPEGKEAEVAAGLVKLIMDDAGGHYHTGIFGHRPLYTVLNDSGHADVTRHLWSITDWPSLGFLTEKHGLTTWPEVPLPWTPGQQYPRNSFSHPMQGDFAAVFHESIGGIRPDPAGPGFKRFFLRPTFLPGLAWAKAEHRSPQGLITSSWKREQGGVTWTVTVPAASTAFIQLPRYAADGITINGQRAPGTSFPLQPGTWTLRIAE